ncbi:hypothetical protein HN031_14290 [Nocardioides sp. zg-1308]|jgi:hypothetical protein|uniref:Uncharacterized protein n=1 Tax=Nocardioides renjunii TaxID=3095075 RepID=A0ABU5KC63_9ACTN|nr:MULTISPECIES: hypothetical protein [unclassified Nocardioides]MDZ5662471.1 hypothetical protein [Nocardioides sp. S-58]NPD05857.1 hypothetical protein [Nocardioides sp. zg-1308]WQQ23732.1 hypothetical protein SHK17_07020 [Nocardioides sp. S-34]
MLSTAITLAAETAEHDAPAVSPYVIGAVALGLLLVLLLAVVSFGGGREHS